VFGEEAECVAGADVFEVVGELGEGGAGLVGDGFEVQAAFVFFDVGDGVACEFAGMEAAYPGDESDEGNRVP